MPDVRHESEVIHNLLLGRQPVSHTGKLVDNAAKANMETRASEWNRVLPEAVECLSRVCAQDGNWAEEDLLQVMCFRSCNTITTAKAMCLRKCNTITAQGKKYRTAQHGHDTSFKKSCSSPDKTLTDLPQSLNLIDIKNIFN